MRHLKLILVIALACSFLGFSKQDLGDPNSLVVYSGRKQAYISPVLKAFEKETGVKILLEPGKTGGLTNRLLLEKDKTAADVFIATTATAMETLRKSNMLIAYKSPNRQSFPKQFYHKDGYWTGITGRARVIIYNTDLVKAGDVPKSVLDLANPKWKGKIVIASTREQTTLAWLSSLRTSLGEKKAQKFIEALIKNDIQVTKGNTGVRRAVGKGEFAIGLTNSPNFYLQKDEGSPVAVVYPDQKAKPGVLVNPNTVAIVKGTEKSALAQKLVDFLLSDKAQVILAEKAYEIPLSPTASSGRVLGLKDFEWKSFNQTELSDLSRTTLRKFSRFSRVGG